MADDGQISTGTPADDTAVSPTPPDWRAANLARATSGKTLSDRLWAKALQMRRVGKPDDEIDNYVNHWSNGQFGNVADVAIARATSARALANADLSKGPSQLATGAQSFANQMGLGIAGKLNLNLDAAARGVGALMTGAPLAGAAIPRPTDTPGAGDFAKAGAEEHPWTATLAGAAGGAVPSTISGMAAEKALTPLLYKIPGLAKLFPGLLKFGARAAVGGAAGGAQGEYAASPDLVPHPLDIAKAASEGALLGFPLGVIGGWGSMKLEPSEHLLGESVQKSTPAEIPSYGAGKSSLLEGTVSPQPIGPPAKDITFTPQSEAAYQQRPEVLRPFNAEKSADLRGTAAKTLPQSFQAATQARNAIRARITQLDDAVRVIEKDPKTGYDAVLKSYPLTEEQIGGLPTDVQRTLNARQVPTAADLYDLYKNTRDEIKGSKLARRVGNKPSLKGQDLVDAAQSRDAMSAALEPVPGFRQLQQQVAPYMQRRAELQAFEKGIVGRAIKPVGKVEAQPKGGLLEEGLPETYGYTGPKVTERAARGLFKPLFSTNIHDLFHFIESEPEYRQFIPAAIREAGSAFGASAAPVVANPQNR